MVSTPVQVAVSLLMLLGAVNGGGWGPEPGNQYSGYITVNTKKDNGGHIFYWMFESRSDPANDPLILWMTGGPGCSSSLAVFYENGPYTLSNDTNATNVEINSYSWNQAANVIYVDQPVGTGFSYGDNDADYVRNEEQVGEDMFEFLQEFFKEKPQFQKSPFFVTGESYGGHYVPAVANRIWKGNQQNEGIPINLAGAAIGNGFVNARLQYPQYVEYVKVNKMAEGIAIQILQGETFLCTHMLKNKAVGARYECDLIITSAEKLATNENFNVYDIRKKCVGALCYDFTPLDNLMQNKDLLDSLGVSSKAKWTECNAKVYEKLANDWLLECDELLIPLLENNVPVLIYSGNKDFICNSLGAIAWTNALKWSGSSKFNQQPTSNFTVDDEVVGTIKSSSTLTFLEIYDAGHMVPMDQPKAALSMISKFMSNSLSNPSFMIPIVSPVEAA